MMDYWLVYGVPAVALGFAGLGYVYLWLLSRAYDRKWGGPHRTPGE